MYGKRKILYTHGVSYYLMCEPLMVTFIFTQCKGTQFRGTQYLAIR